MRGFEPLNSREEIGALEISISNVLKTEFYIRRVILGQLIFDFSKKLKANELYH